MLTDDSTIERSGMIGRFKGFVEHISKDYHTTLVMKTTRPLEDFELASIASHRFDFKIPIEDGISEKEAKNLETLKAEVKRLDDKGKSLGDYWEYYHSNEHLLDIHTGPHDILSPDYISTWGF